ncbi:MULTISPECIES: trigger factor [Prevotellaceae]|jgi:trigger factor|uniref:Peptidylprolyl isomerase n=1 Tax=Xylanibacter rarus TaxID=1676614 RepID=A0A8E1QVM0_9BACT|nr:MULTISPECIES: trigger factor [Prevotellaceae]KOO66969.1 peptidylprolyl isomerase [Xylanibacter rarus]MBS5875436.1 trigger factor [Prevotella sp.]CCX69674.1 trigger factor [Prevotella sp. CAG:255]HJH75533.1 trigger factor [Prevotellaceae bacterium]
MKISFENPDKVNGLLTLTVEEADYKENVEKTLKNYRKKANVPGFRPGMVPMGMIKRQFGTTAKVDEINKLLGEQIYKYVKDNNIQMLGEPLPSDKQEPVDMEKEAPYTFMFDIAVAPEFKAELTGDDTIDYYTITVDDKIIDQQIDVFASRAGHYDKVEDYQANDMLKGDIRELDENGNTKEGGITVEGAVLMPEYIKVEDQKKLFDGAKLGDIITFNPKKAYPESDIEVSSLLKMKKEEVADLTADFSYQITEISRYVKAEVNQELFDQVYGKDVIKDEKDFREKIAEGLKAQFAVDSDFKFIQDVRKYLVDKVGALTYPDALLKRIMLNNNKDKGEEFVEKNYEQSIKELTWHLIKEQLVKANGIKIEDADIEETAKEAAKAQFAQYGMNNIPEEYIENYAKDMLKKREYIDSFVDRSIDRKLTEILKNVVKLENKTATLEEFNKMMQAE